MPMVLYTQDEVRAIEKSLNGKAMKLSQALAEANKFPCIREPDNAGPNGPGEYCSGCPAEEWCPFEFKQLAP